MGVAVFAGVSPGTNPSIRSAYCTPDYIFNGRYGPGSITTDPTTVGYTGGIGTVTFSWAKVSGDTFTVNSPTAGTTTFTVSVGAYATKSAVYRCTATDGSGAFDTADVSLYASDLNYDISYW